MFVSEFNDFPFMSSAARRRDSEEIPFDGGICKDGIGLLSCPVAAFGVELTASAAQH